MIRRVVKSLFRSFNLDIVRYRRQDPMQDFFAELGPEEIEIIAAVRPWTMTSLERIYALIQAVRYVSSNRIPGSVVECGVWKGGSMATVARTLLKLHDSERELYLFDTFEGMSEPTPKDVDLSGKNASDLMTQNLGRCAEAPLESVEKVLHDTGYPQDRMHFVRGRVEDTVPASAPNSISLLRLDTDWYQSTKHELIHLYPRLSRGGVLIIDDYGHWKGARQACNEYFSENGIHMLLNRIDYTGRIALKL
jgi:hypothetical protein